MITLQFCSTEEFDILQIMIYVMNNEHNNMEKDFDSESLLCSLTVYKMEIKGGFYF